MSVQRLMESELEIAAVGVEWLVDATGCAAAALRDLAQMQRVCSALLAALDLRVVGEGLWHQFPGHAGVTGLYLLTESHLACHTYPESGTATFNLYCCRQRPAWAWEEELRHRLAATDVAVRVIPRGRRALGRVLGHEEGTP